mgnify:FL=1
MDLLKQKASLRLYSQVIIRIVMQESMDRIPLEQENICFSFYSKNEMIYYLPMLSRELFLLIPRKHNDFKFQNSKKKKQTSNRR